MTVPEINNRIFSKKLFSNCENKIDNKLSKLSQSSLTEQFFGKYNLTHTSERLILKLHLN